MNKMSDAMKVPHRYVLFDPENQIFIRAEKSKHTVVPLAIMKQGDEAIIEYCNNYSRK